MSSPISRRGVPSRKIPDGSRGNGCHLHQRDVVVPEKELPQLVAQKGRRRTAKEGGRP